MPGPSKQITDDEFDSQFQFEHGQRVSDSELKEIIASEEIDTSLPLKNNKVSMKPQMRKQIKQEDRFFNPVVTSVDRKGQLALAATEVAYMAKVHVQK